MNIKVTRLAGVLFAATCLSGGWSAANAQAVSTPDAARKAAASGEAGIQEIVVTAERRSDTLQNVPIAVSAFSGEALKTQRIEGAADLLRSVPNLSFSAALQEETNFQIRGIGYQIISADADAGVGVHQNNAPLMVSRIQGAQYYDIERVEVLRGPQGTLYGRNATGGVVNTITAKPVDYLSASITGEYGNYNSRRLAGYLNVPIGDVVAVRVAGTLLKRDGTFKNNITGNDTDSKDLNSSRVTVSFKPSDAFKAYFMWERFSEDDTYNSGRQTFCIRDAGPASVGGVAVTNPDARLLLSMGCANTGTVYDPRALGNEPMISGAIGILGNLIGILPTDGNAGVPSRGIRNNNFWRDPLYKAHNDLFLFNVDTDLTDQISMTSLTAYSKDRLTNEYPLGTATSPTGFLDTPLTPGGVFNDPQTGSSNLLLNFVRQNQKTEQFSQELRIQSSFDGPINFSFGGIYLNIKRDKQFYSIANSLTAFAIATNNPANPTYIDPNSPPNGEGHNYFFTDSPYELKSKAGFGELYWAPSDKFKVTAGLRYTVDDKRATVLPINLLAPGRGYALGSGIYQQHDFKSTTWRFNAQWTPELSFTDRSMVYGTISRGYKSGGFNPPNVVAVSPTYKPELVDSYEVGTKNSLFNNTLQLNLTGFVYNYKGYQVTQVVGLNPETVNVNAKVHGLELESIWRPVPQVKFNANVGYLKATMTGGGSINAFNRTQGDSDLTTLKSLFGSCAASTAGVAKLVSAINAGTLPASVLISACPTAALPNGPYASADPAVNPLAGLGIVLPTTNGVIVPFKGKELPNAPHWTVSLGAQYDQPITDSWSATARADFYYQSATYGTIFNDPSDRLRSWTNVNASLGFTNSDYDLNIQFFVKNAFNKTVVNSILVTSESTNSTRQGYLADPRVYGISITKSFGGR